MYSIPTPSSSHKLSYIILSVRVQNSLFFHPPIEIFISFIYTPIAIFIYDLSNTRSRDKYWQ